MAWRALLGVTGPTTPTLRCGPSRVSWVCLGDGSGSQIREAKCFASTVNCCELFWGSETLWDLPNSNLSKMHERGGPMQDSLLRRHGFSIALEHVLRSTYWYLYWFDKWREFLKHVTWNESCNIYRIHKFIALLQLLIIIICYIIIHESGSSMKDKYVCSGYRSNGQGAASGGLLGPPWPLLRRWPGRLQAPTRGWAEAWQEPKPHAVVGCWMILDLDLGDCHAGKVCTSGSECECNMVQ